MTYGSVVMATASLKEEYMARKPADVIKELASEAVRLRNAVAKDGQAEQAKKFEEEIATLITAAIEAEERRWLHSNREAPVPPRPKLAVVPFKTQVA
jgi:hypothetical protein